MTNFNDILSLYRWEDIYQKIYQTTEQQVISSLSKSQLDVNDFAVLVSPAASKYLETMAQKSAAITQKRFGQTIQLFAPLYVSNECSNICTYCGFSLGNKVKRKTLNIEELRKEASFLKNKGYEHVLIVSGEDNQFVNVHYFLKIIPVLKEYFSQISFEVQPLETEEYQLLRDAGVHGIFVYQETYHEERYKAHHPKGKKSNFKYRIDTPDRIGANDFHKIGIGTLIGLEDWRVDAFYTALHLRYLQKKYWKTNYSISFPRLRPFSGGLEPKVPMNDKELVQLICAYRLLDENVELSLSTREPEKLRNNLIRLGITSMSAGSKTNPGGYVVEPESLEQFEISDERDIKEIEQMLLLNSKQPVKKDWDLAYL